MKARDHKVEMWTHNGDKVERMASEDEARQLENEPFRDDSNIAVTRVTPPNEGTVRP